VVRDGEFVVVSVDDALLRTVAPEATVVEDEGITAVLRRSEADALGLAYDYVAAWITLSIHTSLHAVGLTAAFSAALAAAGISCNVLAGLHHDHLLVPIGERDAAVEILRAVSVDAQ